MQYIGYYRFSGYLDYFRQQDGNYFKGSSFKQVLDLYIFDRELRAITFDSIERIEVALRSCITSVMAENHGAFWFLNQDLFDKHEQFESIIQTIRKETIEKNPKKRDINIRNYYELYSAPEIPPSWMVFELLSMGTISLIYKFLKLYYRKQIAHYFKVDEKILTSWIHAFVYTRNLCAHHSRLWNRVFTIKPIAMKSYKDFMMPTDKFSAQAFAIQILLDSIAPGNNWQIKLQNLFQEHPLVNISKMGFKSEESIKSLVTM